ncbi:helix-turn-helix domain-containing protein [Alkalihalobacillus sp. TS-13]|uniref:helix-turn-helix domain-containing protein n=1 Tax=Alkalihalobacillus sp. TS-13 TaxID=2842455 RepID=UPI001C869991|nr:helix-turn-helix domain-containing protein [Alkalihalobacillus sp. TS-13]
MTELGQRLKEARLEKQLSYEELQDKTKIQKRYLQAIEEGQYSVLPGAFYARAFIKNYAEAVGLDPDMLFEEHASEVPASKEGPTEFSPRSSKPKTNVPKDNKLAKVLPLLLTAVLLTALLIAFYWVVQNNSGNSSSEPNKDNVDNYESTEGEKPPEESSETTEGKDGNEESSDDSEDDGTNETETQSEEVTPEQTLEELSSEGSIKTYSLSGTDEFNVDLKINGETYIDVKDESGKNIQPGGKIFKKEDGTVSYELTDHTQVTFNIGATQHVEVTVNGESVTYAVEPSKRPHQKIIIQYQNGTEEQ